MRKSNIRKWFHLIIDFIPLFIIPVFIVYSGNKNGSFQQSIEVEEEVFAESNIVNTKNDLIVNHIYRWTDNVSSSDIPYTGFSINVNPQLFVNQFNTYDIEDITRVAMYQSSNGNIYYRVFSTSTTDVLINSTPSYFVIESINNIDNVNTELLSHIQYTEYKFSLGLQNVTYNDTDIGSQFMYSLYTPIQKMFNFSELGGFKQFYQWISLNIFQGTAPIPFFIVFNIMIYNFLVDIIFLLYSVFMFVIDFCEKCLDRFMSKGNC